MNTRIYIDGFNLYYGAVRPLGCRWLDVASVFARLLPHDSIDRIYYFTSLVHDPEGRARQNLLLEAISLDPRMKIVFGNFKKRTRICRFKRCSLEGKRKFRDLEEKRTDVNIAVHMLDDAHRQPLKRMVLVSGDTDLVPAITMVKQCQPQLEVFVYAPAVHPNRALNDEFQKVADRFTLLPNGVLKASLLPPSIKLNDGTMIHCPEQWKQSVFE